MKNLRFSLSTIGSFTSLAVILLLTSCGSDAQTKKNEKKAPDIDIHTAIVSNNMEALKQHLEAGTNVNEKDPFGGSSPLISASLWDKPEMAKVLLDAGADINFQSNDGSTALHTAAFFCRPEIVKLLLDKKADKTIKNKYGATAYDNVAGSYADLKPTYEMLEKMLSPMGLKLDYAYIEKTRPEIAQMLK